jgi:hypothetical protein
MSELSHVLQTILLYINCLEHIKLDYDLIHTLIERWIHETHTFHLKHRKMTSTLQDVVVLLGLSINEQTITSTNVCNWIMLCERVFGLTPLPSKVKRGSIRFK